MIFEISSPLLYLYSTLLIMVFEISSPSVCLPWVVWNFKSLVLFAVAGNFCCCWSVEPEEAICGKSQNEDWLSCWLIFYHHFAWFWKDHFGKKGQNFILHFCYICKCIDHFSIINHFQVHNILILNVKMYRVLKHHTDRLQDW